MAETDTPSERKWAIAQIREYTALRPRYEEFARTLRLVLEQTAKRLAPLAIVQARAKTIPSFAEKIHRKKGLYARAIDDMTDLCGARVITHTQTEVDAVCKFIVDHFDVDWENSCDVSQRLKPAEFGYLSVHYIVQFRPGVFPGGEVSAVIPESVSGLKAEIQVRTLLQHAWADINHDLSYKSEVKLPAQWLREFATVAAVLEQADKSFCRIEDGLRAYASNYGAYLTPEQMREKIEELAFVLEHDPGNLSLALRMARLSMELGNWDKAIETLSGFADRRHPQALHDLGLALCRKNSGRPKGRDYARGRKHIEAARAVSPKDPGVLSSLAGAWKGIDEDKVHELCRQAFELDPSNSYCLINYLDCEIARRRDISFVSLLTPVVERAIQRCREQADVGLNLPRAYFDIGKLYLLLGRPYPSLDAYAKAVHLSSASFMLEESLDGLDRLAGVKRQLPGYGWMERLLLAAVAAKFPGAARADTPARFRKMASRECSPIEGPVVIVAGGCDPSLERKMRTYRGLVEEAFSSFRGTVVSGGTTTGIGGLIGEIQERCGGRVRTLAYLPKALPADGKADRRYAELRRTGAVGEFSPLEPLQCWIDIVNSGVNPAEVRVLGINGGRIAAAEYRMALALGASVGIIGQSGREASKLIPDIYWGSSRKLVSLPADPQTVRAFVGAGDSGLPEDARDAMARRTHEEYLRNQSKTAQGADPSMAAWSNLDDSLKRSNRQQIDHIVEKLREIGCAVRKVEGRKPVEISFTAAEIERMSEMEHGRWNVERLLDGWRPGDKKDVQKRISPYIVSWKDLSEKVRGYDRDVVKDIPKLLAEFGLEISRETTTRRTSHGERSGTL